MKKIFHIFFSLKGSISRKELWLYSTIVLLLFLFLSIGIFFILTEYLINVVNTAELDIFLYYKPFIIIFFLLLLIFHWIFLALGVKRSHDLNERGFSVFITFILSILILCASFIQAIYVYGPVIGIQNITLPAQIMTYLNYFIYVTSLFEFILFIYLTIHLGFKKGGTQ